MMNDNEPSSYDLNLTERAERNLEKLDKQIARRILRKLFDLAEVVDLADHYALAGKWKGYYRIRIGDYRAIYDLDHDEKLVIVMIVGHRRDVYDV
jgi:mRNA interferase RelE/StbE